MRTAVVTMAQITAEPGQPLDAAFWCGRRDGERHAEWKQRMALLRSLRATRKSLDRAIRKLEGS